MLYNTFIFRLLTATHTSFTYFSIVCSTASVDDSKMVVTSKNTTKTLKEFIYEIKKKHTLINRRDKRIYLYIYNGIISPSLNLANLSVNA